MPGELATGPMPAIKRPSSRPSAGASPAVAEVVAFLASDAAAWITGQTYPVNGGYSFAV